MKKFFFFAVAAICVVACTKPEEGKDTPKEETKVTVEIVAPDDLEVSELSYDNQSKSMTFEWEADSEEASYSLIFSLDKELSNPQTVEAGSAFNKKLTHSELDDLAGKLGIGAYKTAVVYWTVKAVLEEKEFVCSDIRSFTLTRFFAPFVDPRDNVSYRVCKVSDPLTGETFVWLADNLRANKYSDGTALQGLDVVYFAPTETIGTEWVDVFGGYYTWEAAVRDVAAAAEGQKVQGICPTGWHMPSLSEFQFLLNNCTSQDTPGTDLKDKSLWGAGAEGVNSIGFNMAGTGYVWEGCDFVIEAHSFAAFWVSTIPVDGDEIPWSPSPAEFYHQAYSYSFTGSESGAALYVYDRKRNYNVRCVLD